ncbi:MAG: hypothetical protein HOG49_12925 [Candidatus Scalindua sp.]|jgi:hypothetical protein|nr:hypothetical protein [Candidatus Scalindua sp.]
MKQETKDKITTGLFQVIDTFLKGVLFGINTRIAPKMTCHSCGLLATKVYKGRWECECGRRW